jgi:hypothetical protein
MKARVSVAVAALVAALVLGGAIAQAQQVVAAEIGFAFTAGGKDMAAGKYTFEVTAAGPVVVRGPNGASSGLMTVITTLGRHDLDKDPEFVFDKIDGKMFLSEIWVPGKDGLLVLATSGPHAHAVVGGSNPRK